MPASAIKEIDHLTDVAMDYEMNAKPGLGAKGRARAAVIMVGVTERIVYNPSRKPRSFAEIGKPAPAPTARVIPFSTPLAKPTRRVLPPATDADNPFL